MTCFYPTASINRLVATLILFVVLTSGEGQGISQSLRWSDSRCLLSSRFKCSTVRYGSSLPFRIIRFSSLIFGSLDMSFLLPIGRRVTTLGLFIGPPSPLASRKGEGFYTLPRAQDVGPVRLDKAFWLRIIVQPASTWHP